MDATTSVRGRADRDRQGSVALEGCRIVRPRYAEGLIEITAAGVARRSFPLRISESLGICFKVGPPHQVEADGRRLMYPSNAICVRPPGCVWSSEAAMNGFISIDIAPALLPEPGSRGSMIFLPRRAFPDVDAIIASFIDAGSPARLEETVASLVLAIAASRLLPSGAVGDGGGSRHAIARAREFLESSVDHQPRLGEVADAAGVNKFVLIRQFRKAFGTTPHAYLVLLRLNRARTLIGAGASLTEAALATGFADQAHMSRWFKRTHGITPTAYARETERT